METGIKNLVFEGGGILGIAYLGMLKFLDQYHIMEEVRRVAGSSAGAITACLLSFNLDYNDTKRMVDSLDYSKIASTKDNISAPEIQMDLDRSIKDQLNKIYGNMDCVYRMVTKYGWYSSRYFYDWIQDKIALQFDRTKKAPPYTFRDFADQSLHKDERPFKELYVIGTDVSRQTEHVFSYETTPDMEVAQAVRISMSVPLFFEAIKLDVDTEKKSRENIYVDGGLVLNYPINLFDRDGQIARTLGGTLVSHKKYRDIKNLVEFIVSLLSTSTIIQKEFYRSRPADVARSIFIDTGDVQSLDFDIQVGDETYNYLFEQGYKATESYFTE